MRTNLCGQAWKIATEESPFFSPWICRVIGVGSFLILTSLGAFVRIKLPFTPVPITLQVFFVLLSGAVLGPRLGVLSQTLYLSLGAVGMPIFAGASGGVEHLFGPTGGYIAGFPLASWAVGKLLRLFKERPNLFICAATMGLGAVVIHILGVGWLCLITGSNLSTTARLGSYPFILVDLTKVMAASCLYILISQRVRRIFS